MVEGNVPCRVARRVMKDQYREVLRDAGLWSCDGVEVGITECEQNGGQGTIRGRLHMHAAIGERCNLAA